MILEGDSPSPNLGSEITKRAWVQLTERGRVDIELGLELYRDAPLNDLCILANHLKELRHGKSIHFNLNLHVNTTNICCLLYTSPSPRDRG